MTSPPLLALPFPTSAVGFSAGAGPSIGDEIDGVEGVNGVGGDGGERIGEVPLTGDGEEAIDLGEFAGVGEDGEEVVEVSGAGEGTEGGDLANNSVGRRTLWILKIDNGTESRAVFSTRDESKKSRAVLQPKKWRNRWLT